MDPGLRAMSSHVTVLHDSSPAVAFDIVLVHGLWAACIKWYGPVAFSAGLPFRAHRTVRTFHPSSVQISLAGKPI